MNVAEYIRSINPFDLVIVLILFAFFILGFIQGTLRRLIGIAAILFSFILAANLRQPLGDFLKANWTQFPPDYAVMVGFGTVNVGNGVMVGIAMVNVGSGMVGSPIGICVGVFTAVFVGVGVRGTVDVGGGV